MEGFWKAAAGVLIAVILGLAIGKQEKDLTILLSLAACCMTAVVAISYWEPVVDFLWELNVLGNTQSEFLAILLKAVGVTLVSELAGLLCNDAGNGALGKMLQMLGNAVILYLSIPVFNALLTLIREMLGEL